MLAPPLPVEARRRACPAQPRTGTAMDFLLDVWREACRHSEIGDSAASIAPLIARVLPVESLLVRRLDGQRGRLETAAFAGPGPAPEHPPLELGPTDMAALLALCRSSRLLH